MDCIQYRNAAGSHNAVCFAAKWLDPGRHVRTRCLRVGSYWIAHSYSNTDSYTNTDADGYADADSYTNPDAYGYADADGYTNPDAYGYANAKPDTYTYANAASFCNG